jgi:hypothetical protein
MSEHESQCAHVYLEMDATCSVCGRAMADIERKRTARPPVCPACGLVGGHGIWSHNGTVPPTPEE